MHFLFVSGMQQVENVHGHIQGVGLEDAHVQCAGFEDDPPVIEYQE